MRHFISLGAGVQSTVMTLMAARGEVSPMPDGAIFSDTGAEPEEIYKHLDWLWRQLPFPVYVVGNGNIHADHLSGLNTTGQRFTSMPLYTEGGGMGRRQCTREYKLAPLQKMQRYLLGIPKGKRGPNKVIARSWIGISIDEAARMKPNDKKYIENVWPLIDAGMTRNDCIRWFEKNYPGRPLVKSACLGCPYTDNARWRDMKINQPQEFERAVIFDRAIRENGSRLKGMKEQQYVHDSLLPLDEVDFRNLEDMGQINLFENECEGMCGV